MTWGVGSGGAALRTVEGSPEAGSGLLLAELPCGDAYGDVGFAVRLLLL